MSLPYVSCICPTYNRCPDYQHLLEEAIECFYRQDYPADRRELLVLNDCPWQRLEIATPGVVETWRKLSYGEVRILNHPERLGSLGAKYNLTIGQSRGEVILPWEDDDISLPGRISQAVVKLFTASDRSSYFNPQRTWFLNGKDLHCDHSHGVCHNASAFTKVAWEKTGGYPEVSGAQDAYLDKKLKLLGDTASPLGDDQSTWQYIYRWGVSPVHLSGRMPHDEFYAEVGGMPVKEGVFMLRPHWQQDYVKLTQDACKNLVNA